MDPRFYPRALGLDRAMWTEADRNMSEFFMRSWANFAKEEDANPTPIRLFNSILWEPMKTRKLEYLSVNSTNYTTVMHHDYMQKESQFWNDYMPTIIGKIAPTWPPTYQPVEEELRIYRAATWSVLAALIVLLFLTILCSCLYCRAKRHDIEWDK